MKKLFIMISILFLAVSGIISVQAQEEEDLYIRIEALKERRYSSAALTDQYETEILTARSREYSVKISEMKENKIKQMTDRLLLNTAEKKNSAQIQEQSVNAGLFADGYKAKSASGNAVQKKKNTKMLILCTIGCIAAGYILAVVRHRFRERQK